MYIIQIMPEFGLAGAETMCENLLYELKKMGHKVGVISLYDFKSPITERLEQAGIKIEYLDKKPGLDISIIFKMAKFLKKEKPDVVHTHRYVMQYVIPASIMAGIKKRVHTVHNVAKKENGKMARKLAKIFYHRCHVIPVALSNLVKKTIIDEYNIAEEKVPVVFNGVNLDNCIQKLNYEEKQIFTILHIGRFAEAKNHMELVKGFEIFHKKYGNTRLKLIGEGNLKEKVNNYVVSHKLKDCVEFMGIKDNVYSFLNAADIFALPSSYEGIPMTLIEAMGTGLPIVSSPVGGIPDMLEDEKSALLVKGEAEYIAEAFDRLYCNAKLRKKLGKNAKLQSEKFSSKEMAEKYCDIYELERK